MNEPRDWDQRPDKDGAESSIESRSAQANSGLIPDVTIIVPVYNCERYLWKTFDSVFSQDMDRAKIEIIAVDDGSTDASLAILKSIATRHINMIVLSMPNSGSAAAPRNAGLEIATGRYIFFLDADDRIEPDTLKNSVGLADETGSGVVLCKVGAEGPGKRGVPIPTRAFVKDRFAEDFIDSKAFTTLGPTKLFRREIVERNCLRFPTGYLSGEDQPFVMGAYLNSPHISVINNKVYYWIHARADGTNATSQRESPAKILLKNMNLIRTILRGTEPGDRRDTLLARPVMGSSGLKEAFTRQFSQSFTMAERTEAIRQARLLLSPSWTQNLRSVGPLESQIVNDLVVRGDVEGVDVASTILSNKKPLPVEFDSPSQQFVYRPALGSPIADLAIKATTRLESVSFSVSGIKLSGHVGVPGASEGPDTIRLIWRHRRKGNEIAIPGALGERYESPTGVRTDVVATTCLSSFTDGGPWDSFFEATWGTLSLRIRVGRDKAESLKTTPVLFENPPTAALFFTDFGNLTVDVGPSQKYLQETTSHVFPKITGRLKVGRKHVVFVEGPMDGVTSVWAKFEGKGKKRNVEFELLTPHTAAVTLPRTVLVYTTLEFEDDLGNRFTALIQ